MTEEMEFLKSLVAALQRFIAESERPLRTAPTMCHECLRTFRAPRGLEPCSQCKGSGVVIPDVPAVVPTVG